MMELIKIAAGFVLVCDLRSCACEKLLWASVRVHAVIHVRGRVCARVIYLHVRCYVFSTAAITIKCLHFW
jgi:hypothetical protein